MYQLLKQNQKIEKVVTSIISKKNSKPNRWHKKKNKQKRASILDFAKYR